MPGCWFAGQTLPSDRAYDWVKNEDDTRATLWRPYLQTGEFATSLAMNFTSKEDCEKFIREEILNAAFEEPDI